MSNPTSTEQEQMEVRVAAMATEYEPMKVDFYRKGVGRSIRNARKIVWAYYDYLNEEGEYVTGRFRVLVSRERPSGEVNDSNLHRHLQPKPPTDQEMRSLIVQALKRCGLPEDTTFPVKVTVEKKAASSGKAFLRPVRRED